MNIDAGAVEETEAVIQAKLSYDRSERHPLNGWRTTSKVVEAPDGFFLECDVLTSRAEGVPSNYLTIPP